MRLLLRHAEYIEGVAEIMTEKALGNDLLAHEKANAFVERFGRHEFEIERYFDHGLCSMILLQIAAKPNRTWTYEPI